MNILGFFTVLSGFLAYVFLTESATWLRERRHHAPDLLFAGLSAAFGFFFCTFRALSEPNFGSFITFCVFVIGCLAFLYNYFEHHFHA